MLLIRRKLDGRIRRRKFHLIYNEFENYSLMISTTTESNQSFFKCEAE